MPSGHNRTQTSTELIRTDSCMRRKSGYQIGRERNQPATTGYGIDKTRQKHQRAHNQVFYHNSIFMFFHFVIFRYAQQLVRAKRRISDT